MQLFGLTLLFGGLYVGPVLVALLIALRVGRSRSAEAAPFSERALVFLPIVVYLVLEYLLQTRQGMASWQVQGLLAAPGVVTAVLTSVNRRWARASVIATVLVAVVLWWLYPGQTTWRFF
jgi:hypothetical protein